jgi:hypothetical protein
MDDVNPLNEAKPAVEVYVESLGCWSDARNVVKQGRIFGIIDDIFHSKEQIPLKLSPSIILTMVCSS